jgi:uncharacterized membrane protein YidH (DUF202 family)
MVELVTGLVIATLAVPVIAFWAWMFSEMRQNFRLPPEAHKTWLFLFLALNVFGALLYYFTVYRKS